MSLVSGVFRDQRRAEGNRKFDLQMTDMDPITGIADDIPDV